ncbi:MAG TPA: hypothetical protein V6D22_16725 [Candidatus Obscuribacterales bacterium]
MQPKLLSLPFAVTLVIAGVAAPSEAAVSMATTVPANPMSKFYGHAAIGSSSFEQHLQSGLEALEQREYGPAELQLSAASAELRQHNITDKRWLKTRLALGEAFLGEEKLEAAEHVLSDVAARARATDLQIHQSAVAGLAEIERLFGDLKRADTYCQQAIADGRQLRGGSPAALAHVYATEAAIMSAHGLDKTAVDAYRQALKLAQSDANDAHDAAEISCKLAVQLHNDGNNEEAAPLFERAFDQLDREANFNVPLYAAPRLTLRWEQGSPRSRLIADNEYPLKYLLVDNLRVAATAVRSENVIGVLISLANCGRSRLQLAVGPTRLEQMKPKHKDFLYVAPQELDIPLEEEHITDLTWRRRWLNHIEKNRYIPGFLKNNALDVDNFFGNNQFGEFGNWPVIANDETPIVTREEFLYGKHPLPDISTINFLSRGSNGYRPTYLDPGESKTGLVFFQQERFDRAQIDINIGNTMIEIPIDSAGPR